jgi:tetratricopeptide (TPR) repeat protein
VERVEVLKLKRDAARENDAGRYDTAIELLKQIIQIRPRDVDTLKQIGLLYEKVNNITAANEHYAKAADVHARTGFYLKAIAFWKKCLKNDPTHLEAHLNLGDLYAKQGLSVEAKTMLGKAFDECVKRGRHREAREVRRRQQLCAAPSDLDDAAGTCGRCGKATPRRTSVAVPGQVLCEGCAAKEVCETRYNLGIAYKEMGLVDEAVAEFELAAKDRRRLLECACMLGICFIEMGMPKEAAEWFEKGLEAKGRTEEEYRGLRYDLASALEMAGEHDRALEVFTKLKRQSPGPQQVRRHDPHPADPVADHRKWLAPLREWLRRVENALQVLGSKLVDRDLDEVLATLDLSHRVLFEDRRGEFRACVLRLKRAARLLEEAAERRE